MISCGSSPDNSTVLAVRQILNNFESHRRQVVGNDSRAWSWAEGVILFPEALCPMCNGAMKSTRIWHVNERGQRVVAVARLDGGKVQKVIRAVHPHVDGQSTGSVCLGDARSTTEALFLGLGMGSPYWDAEPSWYKEVFDHVCSTNSRRNSRNHLTGSMALKEKKPEAPVIVAETPAQAVVTVRQATVRPRRLAVERPLFDGSMVGNAESTGISADDQPTGLSLDRL